MKTLDEKILALPEDIIKMIPPKPIGYGRGREIVDIRTGLTFDPIAAAETAANLTMDLLTNTAKWQRLIELHARNNSQPSPYYVFDVIIKNTWGKDRGDDFNSEVGRAVDQVVLTQFFNLAAHSESSEQVKALIMFKLAEFHDQLKKRTSPSIAQKAHYNRGTIRIKKFLDSPEKYEFSKDLKAPDGSPIGMGLMCGE